MSPTSWINRKSEPNISIETQRRLYGADSFTDHLQRHGAHVRIFALYAGRLTSNTDKHSMPLTVP